MGAWGGRGPRHIYATDAQVTYLRRLNNEAFSRRVGGFNIQDWGHVLKREASSMIDELRRKLGKATTMGGG
jgi:hypothetical protein